MTPPTPYLLPHLLERAAARAPEQVALRCGDDALTFAELADRVARLATALGDGGVVPGDRVAIHLAKSVDAFVGVHAAQWAGAIAVPVNPASPPSVVDDVFAAVEPAAAIVDAASHNRLSAASRPALVVGPESGDAATITWDDVARHEPAAIADRTGDDPAYLITTSGSTGRPKSIVHTHRSGLRYAQLAAECYGLGPDDVLGNIAPFHFDQSTFELYSSMAAGASVVLVPDVLLRFPANLAALVEQERLTTWYSVPTILQQLAERGSLDDHDLSSLRWVLFGGEVFAPAVVRVLMAHMPNARFSNVYGPAETNQCAVHHLPGPPADGESIPIGRAWDDTTLLVMDGSEPLEGAGTGELLVRSPTMMSGYWGRPDLDAGCFVERDHRGHTQRWYRTGDLIERTDDGLLHFRGRIDRQVKVRGNRIELESVEAAITAAPGVTGAAAIVRGSGAEATLAVVVEATTDSAAIRRHARATLPGHAQPDTVVVVTALPRTQSGKIDVNAAAGLVDPADSEVLTNAT